MSWQAGVGVFVVAVCVVFPLAAYGIVGTQNARAWFAKRRGEA